MGFQPMIWFPAGNVHGLEARATAGEATHTGKDARATREHPVRQRSGSIPGAPVYSAAGSSPVTMVPPVTLTFS
ncbi:hypothetical protein OpiT1DRAFT_00541 [Opitutaceae bacterium TAV1]|nr:hypothetical protein OpiT1DRAFT_00541 [Opitutaceae bacterium TAV1]